MIDGLDQPVSTAVSAVFGTVSSLPGIQKSKISEIRDGEPHASMAAKGREIKNRLANRVTKCRSTTSIPAAPDPANSRHRRFGLFERPENWFAAEGQISPAETTLLAA